MGYLVTLSEWAGPGHREEYAAYCAEVPNRAVPPRQDITMFFSEFCREVVG